MPNNIDLYYGQIVKAATAFDRTCHSQTDS